LVFLGGTDEYHVNPQSCLALYGPILICFLIYELFNDAFNSQDYTQRRVTGRLTNNKLESQWKERVWLHMATVLPLHLPGGIEKTHSG
jgi:hypothetical protein